MNHEAPLPLNEPQQRHIAITLAILEKHLADLRQRLERDPSDLRLTHYEDAIGGSESLSLLTAVRAAEVRLRKMADELGLPAAREPVRRKLAVALELVSIDLYECRPNGGLRGYGEVAPTTAEYLEREIPELDAAVQSLLALLEQAPARDNVTA